MAAHTALDHERAVEPGDEGLGLLRATEAKGTLAVCLDELARATLASGDIGRSARSGRAAFACRGRGMARGTWVTFEQALALAREHVDLQKGP